MDDSPRAGLIDEDGRLVAVDELAWLQRDDWPVSLLNAFLQDGRVLRVELDPEEQESRRIRLIQGWGSTLPRR